MDASIRHVLTSIISVIGVITIITAAICIAIIWTAVGARSRVGGLTVAIRILTSTTVIHTVVRSGAAIKYAVGDDL